MATPTASAFTPVKFLNLRNRNMKIARTIEVPAPYGGTMKKFLGSFIEFVDGEAVALTQADYDTIKRTQPHVYEEPDDASLPVLFDEATNFVTRNKDAYDAWLKSKERIRLVTDGLPGDERKLTPPDERKGRANA